AVLNVMEFYLSRDTSVSTIENSACMFFSTVYSMFFSTMHLFIGVSVSDICAGDFSDKTFYYEILSGQTRFNSYFGRAVTAIIFTLIGSMIIVTAPVVICSAVCGWGTLFTVGDVVQRLLISILPILRIICMYICLAFILKNYSIMDFMAGLMVSMVCEEGFFSNAQPAVLGSTSLLRLCRFDMWANYGLNNIYTPVVDATIPTDEIQSIVIWSIIASAAFLIVGYAYFHHDDLN
ncbi:MAG: hypothetical protein K2I82_00825, partial [Ruminococcus sp.]|nr:hypothetical protein [Ruminococcus sp.]